MNSNHTFRKLIDNKNVIPGKHVTIYTPPKIKTINQIEKLVLKGLQNDKKKKMKLNHVKI